MPAISDDTMLNSTTRESEIEKRLLDEKRRKRGTAPVLIDRVVKEKKEHAVVSPYGDAYTGQGEDDVIEEWTQLTFRDKDEGTPLVEQKSSRLDSFRRHFSPLMCFLAVVMFVMAMLVCSIWTISGVFADTVVIAPDDTIMASYQVDTRTTNNIVYSLTSTASETKEEQLVFYRERCSYLEPSSVEVHMANDVNVSADVARIDINRLYLVAGSSLDYVVNLTLSTAPLAQVPPDCYAAVHIFKDYFAFSSFLKSNDTTGVIFTHRFCNASALRFTLDVSKSSYFFLGLYAANPGQIESVNVKISGALFYYDSSLYKDQMVCTITPPVNSSCTIHTGNLTDFDDKLCIIITRGTPYMYDTGTISSSVSTVAVGNGGIVRDDADDNDDVVRLERRVTTYWAINRVAVFVCLFTPLMIGCCVLAILTPRRTNYGSYVRNNRKKYVNL